MALFDMRDSALILKPHTGQNFDSSDAEAPHFWQNIAGCYLSRGKTWRVGTQNLAPLFHNPQLAQSSACFSSDCSSLSSGCAPSIFMKDSKINMIPFPIARLKFSPNQCRRRAAGTADLRGLEESRSPAGRDAAP
jgi:hypothetical protein